MAEPYRIAHSIMFPERLVALHVMPTGCGREFTVSPGYRWDCMKRGNREFIIWQYTISGEGGLDMGGESLRMHAGDGMLLIVPEECTYYLPKEASHWAFCWVSLCGSEAVRLARECRRKGEAIHRLDADSAVLALENKFFTMCQENAMNDVWQASALGYEFMLQLTALYNQTGGRDGNFMHRINDYCMAHIDEDISVDELAERAGYSKWHFSRLFREYNGISPLQYIIGLKMRMAIQLLQSTKAPVKEIGLRCGFADTGYFCKVFRRTHGFSPGEFRSLPPEKTACRKPADSL